MSDRIVAGVPLTGMKLSAATSKKVKAYEEAKAKYVTFTSSNRDCATPKAYSPFRGNQTPKPAALVKAERELEARDIEDLAKGGSLADRDEFLAPALARIDEYQRTEPLLKRAMETAENAAIAAVTDELPALTRQAMDATTEARKEYAEALDRVAIAEAQFKGHIARVVQYATGGVISTPRYRGLHTDDASKWLSAWEVTDHGRLTWECAWSLGLVGSGAFNVDILEGFIEPQDEGEETPWVTKHENSTLNGNSTATVWNPANYN